MRAACRRLFSSSTPPRPGLNAERFWDTVNLHPVETVIVAVVALWSLDNSIRYVTRRRRCIECGRLVAVEQEVPAEIIGTRTKN